MTELTPAPRTKPLLRGVSHQIGFFAALIAGALIVARAPGRREALGLFAYCASLCVLLGTSALYHRPNWSPGRRAFLRRLDHSAIFILIAGTYTPLCMLALPAARGTLMLWVVWLGAAAGVTQSLLWTRAPRWLSTSIYLAFGWIGVAHSQQMAAIMGWRGVLLFLLGGLLYSVGAVIYARRKPDPWPKVFGYHEIFHVLVLAASALHFFVIAEVAFHRAP